MRPHDAPPGVSDNMDGGKGGMDGLARAHAQDDPSRSPTSGVALGQCAPSCREGCRSSQGVQRRRHEQQQHARRLGSLVYQRARSASPFS